MHHNRGGRGVRVTHVLAVVLVGGACAGDRQPERALRTDSAGVSIVQNTAVDRPLPWNVLPERRLGGEDGGALGFYRVRPGLITMGDDGVIYVLDAPARRVVALTADGEVRWYAGGPGGGPGELENPNSVTYAAGALQVHDPRKAALVQYAASDGAVLEQLSFPVGLFRAWLPHVRALPGGHAYLELERYAGSDDRLLRLVRAAGGDTVQHFARSLQMSRTASYPSCGMTLTMPVLHAAQVRWDVRDGDVAVVTGAEYVVELFRQDGSLVSVRRNLAPEPLTRAEALATLRGESGSAGPLLGGCGASPEERLEKHGHASHRQIVLGVAFDRQGRLWVLRRSGGSGSADAIDIFDDAGEYLGTLPEGTPLPLLFLPDGRVAYAERDDVDVERLVIARLAGAG